MPTSAAPTSIRFESRAPGNVFGIGERRPRISCVIPTAEDGWKQSRSEIEISREDGVRSFEVASAEQLQVMRPGEALASRERAVLRIRVSDGTAWSPWSESVRVETGLGWKRLVEVAGSPDLLPGGEKEIASALSRLSDSDTAHLAQALAPNGVTLPATGAAADNAAQEFFDRGERVAITSTDHHQRMIGTR